MCVCVQGDPKSVVNNEKYSYLTELMKVESNFFPKSQTELDISTPKNIKF